jgi:hypothetical protein
MVAKRTDGNIVRNGPYMKLVERGIKVAKQENGGLLRHDSP